MWYGICYKISILKLLITFIIFANFDNYLFLAGYLVGYLAGHLLDTLLSTLLMGTLLGTLLGSMSCMWSLGSFKMYLYAQKNNYCYNMKERCRIRSCESFSSILLWKNANEIESEFVYKHDIFRMTFLNAFTFNLNEFHKYYFLYFFLHWSWN